VADNETYLDAVEADQPVIATAEIMDRLGERLKGLNSSAEELAELAAAGEAIAEVARDADRPAAAIDTARNEAGQVAEKAGRKKDSIIERIEAETDEVLVDEVEEAVRLDALYGLDRYLEMDLEEVEILRSTDKLTEPVYRWKFSDGAVIEHDDSVHMDRYNFWERLVRGAERKLTYELASEQIGDPDENEERYRQLSLGPEGRPWHPTRWVECIQDLLDERATETEVVGNRTGVWEDVQNWIRQSRAVEDRDDAVTNSQARAVMSDGGDIEEIWVPASVISEKCEEWSVAPNALQAELSERGADSDEVPGAGISEAFTSDGRSTRYWRLDATHEEVPEPDDVVAELDDSVRRDVPEHGFEYGGGGGDE